MIHTKQRELKVYTIEGEVEEGGGGGSPGDMECLVEGR